MTPLAVRLLAAAALIPLVMAWLPTVAAAPSPQEPPRSLAASTAPRVATGCRPIPLPSDGAKPSRDAVAGLARCLTAPVGSTVPTHARTPGRATVTAEAMTVTALRCTMDTCQADRVVLRTFRLSYGSHFCLAGTVATVSGPVRFRADLLSGRLFGVLPLTFSTRSLPPVPLPYVHLTDVRGAGLRLDAPSVHGPGMALRTGRSCTRSLAELSLSGSP